MSGMEDDDRSERRKTALGVAVWNCDATRGSRKSWYGPLRSFGVRLSWYGWLPQARPQALHRHPNKRSLELGQHSLLAAPGLRLAGRILTEID